MTIDSRTMSALIERAVCRVIGQNMKFAAAHPSARPLVQEENSRLLRYLARRNNPTP